MRKHNTIKVILVTILILAILSWILPAAYYSGSFAEQGRTQMGLFDLFNYPLTAVSYFGYIAVFIFAVGGFYGILHRIPAYRNMLDKVVYNLRGNEKLFLVVTMIMFAVLTSTCGAQLALFIFFPFVASVILLLGYDKMVVALTLVGSTMVGMIGTTTAITNVSIIYQALTKVKLGDSMGLKIALLLIGLVLLIITTLAYIKKHSIVRSSVAARKTISTVEKKEVKKVHKTSSSNKNKTNNKSSKGKPKKKNNNKADLYDKDVIVSERLENTDNEYVPRAVNGTHKTWPLALSMAVSFFVLVLSMIPWYDAFGSKAFENATTGFTGVKVYVWIALLIGLVLVLGITALVSKSGKKVLVALAYYLLVVIAAYTVTAGSVTGFILLLVVLLVAHLVAKKLSDSMLVTSCVDLVVTIAFVLIFAAATGFGKFFKVLGSFFGANFLLFGKVLGNTNAFGVWTINDIIPVLFVIALFLIAIYKVKYDVVLDGLKAGFKKALVPAVVSMLIYTILVIVTYHPFQLMLYQAILGWSKTFNLFGCTLVAALSSLFNADPAYAFQAALPYLTSVIKDTTIYPRVALLFQSVYGITMLVAPTSLVLMLVLSYLKINYKDWLKATWLFVIVLLLFVLLVLAAWNVIVAYVLFALLLILMIVLLATKKL